MLEALAGPVVASGFGLAGMGSRAQRQEVPEWLVSHDLDTPLRVSDQLREETIHVFDRAGGGAIVVHTTKEEVARVFHVVDVVEAIGH